MRQKIQSLFAEYPRQFWLLFVGMLISTLGSSMIWPFLMIYASERLSLPLGRVTALMSLNAGMGLIFAFIAGPVTDRLGRKWVMAISLAVNGLSYYFLSGADSFTAFAFLMGLSGAFNPLYRVGADAMMADLVPPEKRPDAYALMRMSNNAGIALGPAIGGMVAATSYVLAFYSAAIGMVVYSLLVAFLAKETLPARSPVSGAKEKWWTPVLEYRRVLRDRTFLSFSAAFTLTQMCSVLIWVLMAAYAKQNYGISERLYGFIPTTNALMVILFQMWVTRKTKRYSAFPTLALGTLLYAFGVGSVALARGFWGFWVSMVILTVGELILTPTATTLAANLAPSDMRGRYMSIYGLTWGMAMAVGASLGGFLNDYAGPQSIWVGGLVIGVISTVFFLRLAQRTPQPQPVAGD